MRFNCYVINQITTILLHVSFITLSYYILRKCSLKCHYMIYSVKMKKIIRVLSFKRFWMLFGAVHCSFFGDHFIETSATLTLMQWAFDHNLMTRWQEKNLFLSRCEWIVMYGLKWLIYLYIYMYILFADTRDLN